MTLNAAVAPRFSLHLPVRYRRAGEIAWHESTTTNVSSSGALLQCDEAMPPGTRLELDITMMAIPPLKASRIFTTSEVVRQKPHEAHLLTTVKHLTYELKHA
jgi:hypothetical protein